MFYLTTLLQTNVEGKEFQQSTKDYEDIEECITAWHTACSSYRTKDTTLKCTTLILNDDGDRIKRDVFTRPQPVIPGLPEE